MSETRVTLPARFYFTRLDQESVEVVLAGDYDAVRQKVTQLESQLADALKYPLTLCPVCGTVGAQGGSDHAET